MSDFDNITPYAVDIEDTTTTTQEFPYSTTTEPPIEADRITAITFNWNSNGAVMVRDIFLHTDKTNGNQYITYTSSTIDVNVTLKSINNNVIALQVDNAPSAGGSTEIEVHCVNGGFETVYVININWGASVREVYQAKVLNTNLILQSNEQTFTLDYVSSVMPTNIFANVNWIKQSKGILTILSNTTDNPRVGTLTCEFSSQAVETIQFTQMTAEDVKPSFDIANNSFDIPATGATVTTNYTLVNGTISDVYNKSWVTVTYTSDKITIVVKPNTQNERNATIAFLWKDNNNQLQFTQNIYITQSAPIVDGNIIIDSNIELDGKAQSGTVVYTLNNVIANTVAVTTDVNWLNVSISSNTRHH